MDRNREVVRPMRRDRNCGRVSERRARKRRSERERE